MEADMEADMEAGMEAYGERVVQKLRDMIGGAKSAVFFGGAGVSTESGIPDFRSGGGLFGQAWSYPPEQILSRTFFDERTPEFFEFYKKKMLHLDAQPNAAHKKLAELERAGRLAAVVTQNVDGLHQKAGSRAVHELHGSVHNNTCMRCGARYGAEFVAGAAGVPECSACGGVVKPDVVLYEEPLDAATINRAIRSIASADVLIIGGTSLAVYPAAGFVNVFRGKDGIAVINRSATQIDNAADIVIRGSIAETLGAIEI
jgi:NAD-dependent deacetylase